MRADPSLLKQSEQTTTRFDKQAFRNAVRRGVASPALSSPKEEPAWFALLEYADFVLEQEAEYCQQ
jgi:hypothetical protein